MTKSKPKSSGADVIPINRDNAADDRVFTRIWGAKVVEHEFTMISSIFFAQQAELGLKPQQAMVTLHLLDYWGHTGSGLPWPSKKRLALRLGVTERQVQRILTDLEEEGLIKRRARFYESGGQKSNAYDLSGLIDRLKTLEPKFRAARIARDADRARIETPARKRRAVSSPLTK